MEEATELMASSDTEQTQTPAVFQTVRVETETLPPLVEFGRKLLLKAQEGDAEAVRDLLKQGAPFTTDWLGTSAIHWACQLNHLETVELLLKAGISRDARNKVDRTPLHVTAQEGHVEILKLLLAHGVDVDATDMLWMTPLHWAAEYGHEECVRLLLQHGADPVAVNKFDKTPDHIAFDNNRLDITHIIQEYAENPLRNQRRKAAKERQKQAAAAHKASIELEKYGKTQVRTILHTDKSPEHKEVRILKLPKRKPISNKVIFEPSLKLADNNKESTQTTQSQSNQPTSDENTEKTLRLLQAHGITMLPTDNSTIVESAVQSGHNVVLTEAGKLALNQTKKPLLVKPQASIPVKGLIRLPEMLKGKKVITIRADQLISMKNERKVVIQTDKKFNPTLWAKQKAGINLNKPKFEVIVKKTMVNNKPFLTSSVVQKPEDMNNSTEKPTETEEVSRVASETEMERIKQELEECKKEMKILKEQYMKKEKEALEYKLIADMLRNNK